MGKFERNIQAAIANEAERLYGRQIRIRVRHGDAYATVGDPDIDGCLLGLFFGMEVKNEENQLTRIQVQRLKEIREAGGFGFAVRSTGDAIMCLRDVYRKARRLRGET